LSQPTSDKGVKKTQLTDIIENNLGYSGRMISGSKTMYQMNNPASVVYFNACIFDELLTQVWYGDIDLTLDKKKIDKIAEVSEQPFYITKEHYRSDFNRLTKEEIDQDEDIIKFNVIKRGPKN
jgi:hypothetical protein